MRSAAATEAAAPMGATRPKSTWPHKAATWPMASPACEPDSSRQPHKANTPRPPCSPPSPPVSSPPSPSPSLLPPPPPLPASSRPRAAATAAKAASISDLRGACEHEGRDGQRRQRGTRRGGAEALRKDAACVAVGQATQRPVARLQHCHNLRVASELVERRHARVGARARQQRRCQHSA
eukprot:scaffold12703_cov48-Phaeocystis_antarctica.AAC.3